ncbi:hypothetical protein BSL78_00002 [Apostichopus japonicus]|uniref:Endonuclease-reverse transcriptase n=1 Tax=Stichopus japonicus TaxID=307972 RepID=A0A2G8LRZ0_STIJA|nr:hypothetical protein BSL78_00002 [Apostichopus japonicus]
MAMQKARKRIERVYTEAAEQVLGKKRRRKKPWIRDETWEMIAQRTDLNSKILGTRSERIKRSLKDDYKEKDREVKRFVRADKRHWVENIAKEAETAASSQNMQALYRLTKNLCNEKLRECVSIMNKDGHLVSSMDEVMERWTEYFTDILNTGTNESTKCGRRGQFSNRGN